MPNGRGRLGIPSTRAPGKAIKSAIMLAPPSAVDKIDYIAQVIDTREMQTALTLVDE